MDQKILNIFCRFPYNMIQKLVILSRSKEQENAGSRII